MRLQEVLKTNKTWDPNITVRQFLPGGDQRWVCHLLSSTGEESVDLGNVRSLTCKLTRRRNHTGHVTTNYTTLHSSPHQCTDLTPQNTTENYVSNSDAQDTTKIKPSTCKWSTVMRRLTAWIRSEKCIVRRFRPCVNVVECTFINLKSIAYYTPRLYGAYCFQATNLYSMLLYWIL